METAAHSAKRALLARLAVLAGAIALGLALQHVVSAQLERIQTRSQTDLLGARAELASLLEVAGVSVFGLTGALGVMIAVACRRSLALLEFPPPGLLSWGSRRVIATGERARRAAVLGIALGVTLALTSAAGSGLLWYMARILRACRAGV